MKKKQLSKILLILGLLIFLFSCNGKNKEPITKNPILEKSSVSLRASLAYRNLIQGSFRGGEAIVVQDIDSLMTKNEDVKLYLVNFKDKGFLLFTEDCKKRMDVLGFSEESPLHYTDTLNNEILKNYVIKSALNGKGSHNIPQHIPSVFDEEDGYPRYDYSSRFLYKKRVCNPTVYPLFSQQRPFNRKTKNGEPLGCGPVAIAGILSSFEAQVGGAYVDWTELKKNYCNYTSLESISESNSYLLSNIQTMMANIWLYCHIWSNQKFTMSTSKNIINYFGYNGFDCNTYDAEDYNIIDHFKKGDKSPLIVRGWEGAFSAHYWVIDGMSTSFYENTTTMYLSPTEVTKNVSEGSSSYLHCVWGWGGDYNGWFHSSLIFDVKSAVENDNYKNDFPLQLRNKKEDNYKVTKIFEIIKR